MSEKCHQSTAYKSRIREMAASQRAFAPHENPSNPPSTPGSGELSHCPSFSGPVGPYHFEKADSYPLGTWIILLKAQPERWFRIKLPGR